MEKKKENTGQSMSGTGVLNKNSFHWLWSFTEGRRGIQIVILWILRYAFHSFSTYSSHSATFGLIGSARKALLKKLNSMPLGAVQSRSSGEYKNIICDRVDQIETTLAHVTPEFTANIVGAVAMFVYMMSVDWRVGLWQLICIPAGFIAFSIMMASTPKYYPATIEKTKALNAVAVEYIGGIEVIKAFGQSGTSYDKFVKAAKEGADCFIEWMRKENFWQNFGMACFPATMLGLLPSGVIYCMNGTLSFADFIVLIILSLGTVTPLVTVFAYTDDISKVGEILSDIADIMDEKDLKRPESAVSVPKDHGIILKNVHFTYKDKEVLHGINMEIADGTVNALVGPSGSGKSTIARLIASLWDVDSGVITIGSVNIKDMSLEEYNKHVAYVSQENYLFDQTVMDNIRMGKEGATDEEVIEAAKKCGCHDFIMSLENGYQMVCGGSGGHLSGGERQRISIARAMLKDAPIVILDEATSYTDPESEAVIQGALSRLTAGKTLIVIAHRLSTIADADRFTAAQDAMVSRILEYVRGIAEIRNFNLFGKNITDVDGSIDSFAKFSTSMETTYEIIMFFLNILNKLAGVVMTVMSIAFYLNGSMSLVYTVMMIICSFMIFESLDQVGAFNGLTRAIENCVDKANLQSLEKR